MPGATSSWILEALVLVLVVLVAVQSARLFIAKARPRWRIERHRRAGARGEAWARRFLTSQGYAVEAEQVTTRYELRVNGVPQSVPLRADYLVRRAGRLFVAEVKAGADAARIGNSATRRQLLEYRLAFDVDGVLLVDAHGKQIIEVELPAPRARSTASSSPLPWLFAAALLAALVWWRLVSR